ncbi:hypothetical protein DSO57_1002710 [Entomophthora muscae]|uniref:Uncharacterized protein n=1 Tax=Entomophthora muscae TaxID=34485 RepID=A0ACC2UTP1_9FUNG|nr:hypothetical protein DSO57_1002710 [Entomophthora muscae]
MFYFFSNKKDEMVKLGDLIPAESYLSKYGNSSNQDWGGWFWRKVSGLFTSAPPKLYREFAVQSKLANTIDRILKHFNSVCVYTATDSLFDLPGFICKICRPSTPDIDWDAISEPAIDILLAGLYERGCAVRKEGGVNYIKLINSSVNRNAMKLTDVDLNVLSVKKAYERLRTQSQKLEEQIAGLHAKIKESVQAGNKSQAVRQLKQRKQLDSLLDNRLAAAENLNAILNQVQQTELDRLVVDAYQEGSKGLRELLAGIGVDQVQTAMDQIQDALADYADVQETISTPLVPDDDALEAELNSLLREEAIDASDSLISQLEKMKIFNDPLPADPIKSPVPTAELG